MVFLTQDATPASRDWLARLLAPLVEDPSVAAVQGGIEERPAAPPFFWHSNGPRFYFTAESERWIRRHRGIGLSSVNLALRRTAWARFVLAPPPSSRTRSGNRRRRASGHVAAPEAAVHHSHHYTFRSLVRRCQDEGFGWRGVGERYGVLDLIRDTLSPAKYLALGRGLWRREVRSGAEVVLPFVTTVARVQGQPVQPAIAVGGHVRVTAVACTHNRGPLLRRCLRSLARQELAVGAHEILVVDNASTDDSPRVIDAMRAELGADRLRSVREPELGLSAARNAAVREAAGEILAFVDDEPASPPPAGSTRSPARWCRPRCGRPVGRGSQAHLRVAVVALAAPTPVPGRMGSGNGADHAPLRRYPRGVNLAFRRETFEVIGGFSTRLGRKGTALLSYEEVELCYRVERAGGLVHYAPGARVRHAVATERCRRPGSAGAWPGRAGRSRASTPCTGGVHRSCARAWPRSSPRGARPRGTTRTRRVGVPALPRRHATRLPRRAPRGSRPASGRVASVRRHASTPA